MSCIALITDFGLSDEYVGVMKGVILSIHPNAKIVDITHHIDPQDVVQAAYLLQSAYRFFPSGTIHVAVVDPGVGTERSILVAQGRDYCFLAPDNGILTLLWEEGVIEAMRRVENPDYFLHPVSRTFHGRDIFAPAAGHLSAGLSMEALGPMADPNEMARLDVPNPTLSESGEWRGSIISVDHFGNLVTNISKDALEKIGLVDRPESAVVRIGNHCITGLSPNYESGGREKPLAIIGGRGYLEIVVNQGNARRALGVQKRDGVWIGKAK